MSEKKQGTTNTTYEKMLGRYGDNIYHKHNKHHGEYRLHYRTHPVQILNTFNEEFEARASTGLVRALKLRRMRTRANSRLH